MSDEEIMDSKKLEILVTAIDLGSFTKASEVVGYTQSGLTHLVDSIENEIGFPIIDRGHGGISLNENGKKLMPYIREFLKTNSNLDNRITEIKQERSGTIRVAAYASIAMHWLPQILYSFKRICPQVDIDLRMVDNAIEPFELLDSGKTDIIFASLQDKMNCEWIPLHEELMCAILPKSYPVSNLKEFPLTEFQDKEFLMPYGKFDIDVNRALNKANVTVKKKSTTVDDETVIRMVGHGLGISMMSELMFKGREKDVLCIPVSPRTVRQLGMGVKKESKNVLTIRNLIDCVLSEINSIKSE